MAVRNGFEIGLDPEQISGFINGVSDGLNSQTLGFGLTLIHELNHTAIGGGLNDRKTIRNVNQIRAELGPDFGQRRSHKSQTRIVNGNAVQQLSFGRGMFIRFEP